jgi:hypothetical protein
LGLLFADFGKNKLSAGRRRSTKKREERKRGWQRRKHINRVYRFDINRVNNIAALGSTEFTRLASTELTK